MSQPASLCPACSLELVDPSAPCPRCSDVRERTEVLGADAGRAAAAGHAPDLALAADERYEVVSTLGRGGMGVVYKVRDRALDEVIAVKVLLPIFQNSADAITRFKRELKIARRINHPNVARLYDLLLWRGRLAISQEFIDGTSLEAILAGGALAPERFLRYVRYLCSALQAAHKLDVVHRDLKPANILIDRNDEPRILDFGIATLTTDATRGNEPISGTPRYMPPEQGLARAPVDRRADLYSLGVIVYQMATGSVPFSGKNMEELLVAHRDQRPRPPSSLRPGLAPGIDEVVLKLLEKDPGKRHGSAQEVYDQLESLLGGKLVHHRTGVAPPRALAPGRKGKVLVIDDDPLMGKILSVMLEALGVAPVLASDGSEGIRQAMDEKPDLILLDIRMPVLDGHETLRILKHSKETGHIPVVMLTAVTDPEELLFSKEHGAASFLNKPIEPDVLALVVERYLR